MVTTVALLLGAHLCIGFHAFSSLHRSSHRSLPQPASKKSHLFAATDLAVHEHISTPRIVRVSVDGSTGAASKRALALYIPGVDGVGSYSYAALTNVSLHYDLYRFEIPPEDRSSLVQISRIIVKALVAFDAPVLLIGESFGGLLAAYIATLPDAKPKISELLLVNPATSYDRTLWDQLSPLVTKSGAAFPVVGLATLFATVVQPAQFIKVFNGVSTMIRTSDDPIRELNTLYNASQEILRLLPPATIDWRLSRWLNIGTRLMESRWGLITTPTLVLIGVQDRMLPSFTEGFKLEKVMKNAAVEVEEFREGGHALLDDSVDLLNIMSFTRTFGPPRLPPPVDIPFPSQEDIDDVEKRIYGNFVKAFSPVFLSKDAQGNLQQGISGIPVGVEGRPVLLVGNHQLYGADTGLIIREFILKRNVLVRGLAHPMLFNTFGRLAEQFQQTSEQGMFSRSTVMKFGGVEVSPGSIYELMKRNETILLFPGGVEEALHGKGEAYKVKWDSKTDFVRMAASFGAIIVPFGAIGVADSLNMLFDANNLPIVGYNLQRALSRLPRPKAAVFKDFAVPVVVPTTPRRIYFLFQQGFDTATLDVYNKTACKEAYQFVKKEVQDSVHTLLEFRKNDPFDTFLPRVAYETLNSAQAPTAKL